MVVMILNEARKQKHVFKTLYSFAILFTQRRATFQTKSSGGEILLIFE